MAECKQTAQEFIQEALAPMVAVLCSHDAQVICQKNNLSFVEMIQPFCRLNSEGKNVAPSLCYDAKLFASLSMVSLVDLSCVHV